MMAWCTEPACLRAWCVAERMMYMVEAILDYIIMLYAGYFLYAAASSRKKKANNNSSD
jgi:hypothetical protein